MSTLESLLKRDRRLVAGGLVLVIILAWVYTLLGVGMKMSAFEMTRHNFMTMAPDAASPWTLSHTLLMLAMWWVMMIAMMLPSAAPTILLAAALNRRSKAERPPYGSAAYFTFGYLLIWLLFSAVALAAQWLLQQSSLLSMMQSNSGYLSGGLLIIAGFWQFSPIKQACLRHCRSPVEYLTRHRRSGNSGALLMGIGHGSYCLGCCWFLMALLFVGGVMNIYWIVGLALYVLIEKLLPYGKQTSQLLGIVLVIAGLVIFFF